MVYMTMWNRVINNSWCIQPKWYKYCSKAVADTFWCWCSHPNNALNKQCLHVDPAIFSKGILVLIHAQTATGMILDTYANVSKSWGCSNIYQNYLKKHGVNRKYWKPVDAWMFLEVGINWALTLAIWPWYPWCNWPLGQPLYPSVREFSHCWLSKNMLFTWVYFVKLEVPLVVENVSTPIRRDKRSTSHNDPNATTLRHLSWAESQMHWLASASWKRICRMPDALAKLSELLSIKVKDFISFDIYP